MKRLISIILILCMLLSVSACGSTEQVKDPTINGTKITEFTIVYDYEGLDYNKRAAEYIRDQILNRSGLELKIVDDSAEPTDHEIVVGETSRAISAALDAETKGLEFAIMAKDGSVALEGDYFIIAAAAYYFMETYVLESGYDATVPEGVSIHEPIVKDAKNFIVLIGDGMGVNQTLLYDQLEDVSDYSDKESVFYGYALPALGYSRTESLSGVTDSAAGGTAISCGLKTINGYVGQDKNMQDVKSLTELAAELGMATAVMSTETQTGATPASFSSHTSSRSNSSEIREDQGELIKNGTVIDCGYDYYNARYMAVIEKHVTDTLDKIDDDEDGFFLMYEEAHIDKHSHKNDIDKTYLALIRFNQVIARFMEFTFYNPDTFILITADHETGDLRPDENGVFTYNSEDHSAADVPIFAYGDGSELFNGKTIENAQIGQTIASFLGVTDFGDQSEYGYLK